MNREDFSRMLEDEFQRIRQISEQKGADYIGASDDEFANFKRNAEQAGVTPEVVWLIYAGKHWDAIATYCREGEVRSEAIEGRLHDVIVYCTLLLGMVREKDNPPIDVRSWGQPPTDHFTGSEPGGV